MKMYRALALIILLLLTEHSYGQNEDSLVFAKKRVLTSLFGSISTQQVDVATGGTVSTTGYTIGTKSGVFIRNNWALGVNFSLSKTEYKNTAVGIDSETLLLGLWNRLYFARKGGAVLYAELTPFYTAVSTESIIQDDSGLILVNESIYGTGFGILPGIGFTYIINRNVGFGMTLAYSFAKLNTEIEDLVLSVKTSDTYNVSQLQLSFNFQIYLDQFFF